jgi:hypothetical protein
MPAFVEYGERPACAGPDVEVDRLVRPTADQADTPVSEVDQMIHHQPGGGGVVDHHR